MRVLVFCLVLVAGAFARPAKKQTIVDVYDLLDGDKAKAAALFSELFGDSNDPALPSGLEAKLKGLVNGQARAQFDFNSICRRLLNGADLDFENIDFKDLFNKNNLPRFSLGDIDFKNVDYEKILESFGLSLDNIKARSGDLIKALNIDFANVNFNEFLDRLTNFDFPGVFRALGLDICDINIPALLDILGVDLSKINPERALELLKPSKSAKSQINLDGIDFDTLFNLPFSPDDIDFNNIDFENLFNNLDFSPDDFDFKDIDFDNLLPFPLDNFDFSNIDYEDILDSFGLNLDNINFEGILKTLNIDFANADLDMFFERLAKFDLPGALRAVGIKDLDNVAALLKDLNVDFSKINPERALELLQSGRQNPFPFPFGLPSKGTALIQEEARAQIAPLLIILPFISSAFGAILSRLLEEVGKKRDDSVSIQAEDPFPSIFELTQFLPPHLRPLIPEPVKENQATSQEKLDIILEELENWLHGHDHDKQTAKSESLDGPSDFSAFFNALFGPTSKQE